VISSNCSYHVIPSTSLFLLPCDTFNLLYVMWYFQSVLYHMIPLICFISCDAFKLFIPCDIFNLFYTMWCIQTVLYYVIPLICFI
jgi:hypothetical protein